MIIPFYVNIETNSIKSTPVQILQNTLGVSLKFIPYTIESDKAKLPYVSTINGDPVYPPEADTELPDIKFDFISISFTLPDGQRYIDSISGDTYDMPIELTTVTGRLSFTVEFYKDSELVCQKVLSPIEIIQNEDNPIPITIQDNYPILKNLIKEVLDLKAQLVTKEQLEGEIQILKANNKLV